MNAKKNNQLQLSAFFEEEYQALKGFVKSKIDNTTEIGAEDILQDVALKIFSRPENALPINNIPGFVYRTLKNKIIDTMRTKKERIHNEEEELDQLWTAFTEQFYESEDHRYSKHLTNTLKKAISELKPAYQAIIVAVDFEGYSYREIARETGIPEGTLMSRRHRAMSVLQRTLEKEINL